MIKNKLSPYKTPLAKIKPEGDLNKPGVFLLYQANMGPPTFVGRADVSLYQGMKKHRDEGIHKYYKILPCENPAEAFKWESIYWHTGQKTILNSESRGGFHPMRPTGSHAKCPYPGCTHEDVYVAPLPDETISTDQQTYDHVLSDAEVGLAAEKEEVSSVETPATEEPKVDQPPVDPPPPPAE